MTRAVIAAGMLCVAGAGALDAGMVVTGRDRALVRPPTDVAVAPYANAGYRLTVRADGVEVTSAAPSPNDRTPFRVPGERSADARDPQDPRGSIARLARGLVEGAETQGEAMARILGWMSRNVSYVLDRQAPQDAASVLERRSGYCTGVARLAVALLREAGIEAREVPGWVAENGGGYHRWIETYDAATGWTFSDPLRYHGFVPATYLRLDSELVPNVVAETGAILEREDRVVAVDRETGAAEGVRSALAAARSGASLRIAVAGEPRGAAQLEGMSRRRTLELAGGEALFSGLPAGGYLLRVTLDGGRVVMRQVELYGQVRAEMFFPAAVARRDEAAGKPGESLR